MKKLENPKPRLELDQGRDRRVAEAGVAVHRRAHCLLGQGVADEAREHVEGHVGVGPTGHAGERGLPELRPGLGRIEAAVRRDAAEQRLGEVDGFAAAARADITH